MWGRRRMSRVQISHGKAASDDGEGRQMTEPAGAPKNQPEYT